LIYSFDEEVAKIVGVEAAVILDKFTWWIRHNEANGKNFYEGKYWTFNSTKAMEKMFPFFNMWKIGRITKKLVDDGYLVTGNFNKLPFDRTLWYTLSEKGEQLMKYACHDFVESQSDALQNCKMSSSENAQPIPVPTNNKNNNSSIGNNEKLQKDAEYEGLFAIFYNAYPKHKGKVAALKAFKKLKPDRALLDEILKALEWQKQQEEWKKDRGQFIPNPATYLNGRRWEDEKEAIVSQEEDYSYAGADGFWVKG
jgi:hypothetical protein